MALAIPRHGLSTMLKEGTKSYKGVEESVLRNIEACTELAATVKSAYGPRGMNKIVINHLQKLFVTSDAATILSQLEVEHPAAKMLIFASQMQDQEVGDGTNTVLILGAALLEHAEELIRMGLNPTEIADGYDLAAKKAFEILESEMKIYNTVLNKDENILLEITCGKVDDIRNKETVKRAIKATVASKHYGEEDFIAELVTEACCKVLPAGERYFNVDNVRICKILGAGVMSSKVMLGMVFKKGVEGSVRKIEKANIAVFTCPFDLTQTET
uniref:T-complex protein 1 subunit theta n=1 Tax=Romanomermis culicivorax TaxID=13658 RepID=A0A915KDN3_ROMCU